MIEDEEMRSLVIALGGVLTRPRHVATAREEFCAVTIDCTRALDTNILSIRSGDHHDISIAGWNIVSGFVVFDLCAAEEPALCCDLQSYVAFELDCANYKVARWNQHCSTVLIRTSVDCFLYCDAVESVAVSDGAEISNVVDACACVFFSSDGPVRSSGSRCD